RFEGGDLFLQRLRCSLGRFGGDGLHLRLAERLRSALSAEHLGEEFLHLILDGFLHYFLLGELEFDELLLAIVEAEIFETLDGGRLRAQPSNMAQPGNIAAGVAIERRAALFEFA